MAYCAPQRRTMTIMHDPLFRGALLLGKQRVIMQTGWFGNARSKTGAWEQTSILCFTGFQEKAILQTKNSLGKSGIHNFHQREIIAEWPRRLTEYFILLQEKIRRLPLGKRPKGRGRSSYKAKQSTPHSSPLNHFHIMSFLLWHLSLHPVHKR